MKKVSLGLVLFLVLVCALSAQAKPRLAILPFTGGTGNDGEVIAELFSFEPEIGRVFERVPRTSSVDAIMREQQFQRSTGLTDSDTIARLGRQLNADYVVAGHIQSLGRSNLVLITIIHVESLQQIAGDYREYRIIDEMMDLVTPMARRIAAASQLSRVNLPTLAVLPFAITAAGVDQQDAEILAQLLATEIANSGRYAVLPRTSSIESVMREHHIQRTGITDPSSIREIGRALNARYVLAGNVNRLGQTNLFTAQILEVERASLIVGDRESYREMSDGLAAMAALGSKLTAGSTVAGAAPARAMPANMIRIEGGSFQMGSASGGSDNERPVRRVTVSAFWMGRHPVTQAEFEAAMGSNPSRFRGPNRPVENVNWFDAIEFCNRLSQREGLTPAYTISGAGDNRTVTWNRNANGYRLPTEAEWEFAARGGNGSPENFLYSGSNNAADVAWFTENSGGSTQDVGGRRANALGLFDMSGNVWEWCWDWYGTYQSGAQTDPLGAFSGSYRVMRGGSWNNSVTSVRSAQRGDNPPTHRINNLGFRVVRSQ